MSFTNDPASNIIDRIRLNVGDTDTLDEGLSDEIYQYIIDVNTVDGITNEGQASIDALKALVAKYANCITEKAGGLFVKGSEKYEQYKQLLDDAVHPLNGFLASGAGFTGGIYCDEINANINSNTINHNPFFLGEKTSLK